MHVPDLDHRKVITLRRGELTTTPRDITDVFGTTHALVLRRLVGPVDTLAQPVRRKSRDGHLGAR